MICSVRVLVIFFAFGTDLGVSTYINNLAYSVFWHKSSAPLLSESTFYCLFCLRFFIAFCNFLYFFKRDVAITYFCYCYLLICHDFLNFLRGEVWIMNHRCCQLAMVILCGCIILMERLRLCFGCYS